MSSGPTPNVSKTNLHANDSTIKVSTVPSTPSSHVSNSNSTEEISRPSIGTNPSHPEYGSDQSVPTLTGVEKDHSKDSHAARLRQILDEPALRSLFREFLRNNFCEENLSFWLDVQDFKRRFNTTSSAVATPAAASTPAGRAKAQGHAAMEKHQQDLIAMAFVIYNSVLTMPSPYRSPS